MPEIAKYMHAKLTTPARKKTALAITIASRERDILKTIDYEHGYSLYIGIPFCRASACALFLRLHVLSRWEHMVDPYLDALIKELIFISERRITPLIRSASEAVRRPLNASTDGAPAHESDRALPDGAGARSSPWRQDGRIRSMREVLKPSANSRSPMFRSIHRPPVQRFLVHGL